MEEPYDCKDCSYDLKEDCSEGCCKLEVLEEEGECDWHDCHNEARWEVSFDYIDGDYGIYDSGGNSEFQRDFCDKHFIELSGCGNTANFRRIGNEEWINFGDNDSPFILKGLVEKSCKVYINDKSKFKKITDFFKKKKAKGEVVEINGSTS